MIRFKWIRKTCYSELVIARSDDISSLSMSSSLSISLIGYIMSIVSVSHIDSEFLCDMIDRKIDGEFPIRMRKSAQYELR